MRAHCLQHVPFEGLGSIEPWLLSAEYDITHTRLFETTELPNLEEVDFLIAMGGPMSVNDESEFPWLAAEKRFIRRAIDAGKRVLGICLGAQLIANALGARVYPNRCKEIGWFPVQSTPVAANSALRFPPSLTVFHWHGETFDLPPGAVRLAGSEGCENQAFQIGRSVIGLQFHLETTPESARDIAAHCRRELIPARWVQTEEEILSVEAENYLAINEMLAHVLGFLQWEDA